MYGTSKASSDFLVFIQACKLLTYRSGISQTEGEIRKKPTFAYINSHFKINIQIVTRFLSRWSYIMAPDYLSCMQKANMKRKKDVGGLKRWKSEHWMFGFVAFREIYADMDVCRENLKIFM